MEIGPAQQNIAASALRKMFVRSVNLVITYKPLKTLLITIVHLMSPLKIGVRLGFIRICVGCV